MSETASFREPGNGTDHLVYIDNMGRPDECTEDCPGCHWEGNIGCEALLGGCDVCDPDGAYAYARENAAAVGRVRKALDALSRETNAYEAGYKGWANQVIRDVRTALDGGR